MKVTINEVKEMKRLYSKGYTCTKIGIILKRDPDTISDNLKKHGVIIRTQGKGARGGSRFTHDIFLKSFIEQENTKCWEWQKGRNKRGYGQFWNNDSAAMIGAHRYSYLHYKGKIRKGKIVCHTCDNPGCVNPDHLFLGTHKDNMHDKIKKGRTLLKDQRKPFCRTFKKLQIEEIQRIEQDYKDGMTKKDLAIKYDVNPLALYKHFKILKNT